MSLPPIPCAHCGTNFMRRDIDPEAPKLCNNCVIKAEARKPKGENKMTGVKILIECDRETQIEVEELCVNQGISISDYFVKLHRCAKGQIFCNEARVECDSEVLQAQKEEMEEFHKSVDKIFPKGKGKKK